MHRIYTVPHGYKIDIEGFGFTGKMSAHFHKVGGGTEKEIRPSTYGFNTFVSEPITYKELERDFVMYDCLSFKLGYHTFIAVLLIFVDDIII